MLESPPNGAAFVPNAASGDHTHGAIEMLYVLSGELEHVVNGRVARSGRVRPTHDKIRQRPALPT